MKVKQEEAFYFQDEMRFGTRTELAKRWTAKGVRPNGEQLIGYEFGYLSAALSPRTGELFAVLLPNMRVESFQAFLDEFTAFLGENNSVQLILDGASAHRSPKLKISENLQIEHLPPYSPELNPVERLFKELRRELKNTVFEDYEAVEEAVIKAEKRFMKNSRRGTRFSVQAL